MEITLNGQIGPSAADHVAAASKRGNVNASTLVPATTAEIVKRLGRQSRKFIVIHSPVQCTETGAHGTCGVSALSSVDQASANACASVTIHRPSLEEKTALVQTDRPCLAVCLIAQ